MLKNFRYYWANGNTPYFYWHFFSISYRFWDIAFKVCRLRPRPFSLFRTVFEIFDYKVFRVWPWPLTIKGHLRSKIFSLFESPYMTSYLTSVDTLSRTVSKKNRFKILKIAQNGGFWPFEGQGHKSIFSNIEKAPPLTKRRRLRYCA